MPEDAPMEVVSHADVERVVGTAWHDVHAVAMFAEHELLTTCHPERSRGTLCFSA